MSTPFQLESVQSRQALFERLMFLGQMGSTETALFHQKVAESYGMSVTDMKTISTLTLEGPMTAGQIASRLNLTSGAVTALFDRLEKRGIIKRQPDAHDRRKVIAHVIEQKPVQQQPNPYQSMGEAYQQLLDKCTDEQLAFLVDYHEKQIEITKQQIAQIGTFTKDEGTR